MITVFLCGCVTIQKNKETYTVGKCIDNVLSINVSKIEAVNIDSILIFVKFTNNCEDSLVIMNDYTKPILHFPNNYVKSNPVQVKQIYPAIEFSSKWVKNYFLKNKCRPSITSENITVIPPSQSEYIAFNIRSLGYQGFGENINYLFSVSFDVSDEIKSYCPYVWSGYTKSPNYSFMITRP